jgi:acyl CoA:acetate/3-ketoacid CoA transferase beta subunit
VLAQVALVHANSAREAIVKMCTLPLLAGENVGTLVPTCSVWDVTKGRGRSGISACPG